VTLPVKRGASHVHETLPADAPLADIPVHGRPDSLGNVQRPTMRRQRERGDRP